MNPVLLLPAALAALGALLLPLLIHLARRSQQRPTPFAALRWLRSAARPQRRVRLEEWPLLLLRLLLIALLALWLARPALLGDQPASSRVLAVPGVDVAQVLALAEEGEPPPRWLAPGFPALDQPPPAAPLSIASLLRQLDSELPANAALTLAVPERLEGVDAQRPLLSRQVDWRVLPGAMPAREPFAPAPPALQVRHGVDEPDGLRYLRAAVRAWYGEEEMAGETFPTGPVDLALDADATHLLWLADAEVPGTVLEWIQAGGVALLGASATVEFPATRVAWWRDARGETLVEGAPLGRGRLLRFTRPLAPGHMPELLEPGFPQRLREVLEGPMPTPASVAATDHAPLAGAQAYPQPPRDLRPWLTLLIALVFLAERWLATSRRRETASAAGSGVQA